MFTIFPDILRKNGPETRESMTSETTWESMTSETTCSLRGMLFREKTKFNMSLGPVRSIDTEK